MTAQDRCILARFRARNGRIGAVVHRIIYTSQAADGLQEQDVKDILETARTNNQRLGVTGILFLVKGEFLQVLEGESAVFGLYDRIGKDPRHTDVSQLVKDETPNRYFSQWAMAYSLLTDEQARRIGGSFNLNSAADFVSYIKRPDAYLSELFRSAIREISAD